MPWSHYSRLTETSSSERDGSTVELLEVDLGVPFDTESSPEYWPRPDGFSDSCDSNTNDTDQLPTHCVSDTEYDISDRNVNPEFSPTAGNTFQATRNRPGLRNWRFGVACSAGLATTVLLLNITLFAVTTWTSWKSSGSLTDIGTLYKGSCNAVNEYTTVMHVVINVLSTLLLAVSNYTMQCLSSPTRREIEMAHSYGDYLDIGILSLRNVMGKIERPRSVLWFLLAVSSFPIHLVYNSVIFKTLDSNDYFVLVVNDSFLAGDPVQAVPDSTSGSFYFIEDIGNVDWNISDSSLIEQYVQRPFLSALHSNHSPDVQNLSNSDCIRLYGVQLLTSRDNVLLVTSAGSPNTGYNVFYLNYQSFAQSFYDGSSWAWMCDTNSTELPDNCDLAKTHKDADSWTVNNQRIDYCLSQTSEDYCEMQFSSLTLAIVIMFNGVKCLAMWLTLRYQTEATIVTLGDAVASFLEYPGPAIQGNCLSGKSDIHTRRVTRRLNVKSVSEIVPGKTTFVASRPRRWLSAVSTGREIRTIGMFAASLLILAFLLMIAAQYVWLRGTNVDAFTLGFGVAGPPAMLEMDFVALDWGNLMISTLVANCPQLVVTSVYIVGNGMLASMLLAREWNRYYLRRAPLRVSYPRGQQKTAYPLQFPLKYSVPLQAAGVLMHWLMSQSLFVAKVNTIYDGEVDSFASGENIGFSCPPMLVALVLGLLLFLTLLALGSRTLPGHMPIVGSCSLAIAAACRRPADDVDAAFLPVSWGELYDPNRKDGDVAHCCFTSHEVQGLTEGRVYA